MIKIARPDASPLKLTPVFKDYIWGGTKLKTDYNKQTDLDIVAESWELSDRPEGQSVVSGGEYDGCSLEKYIAIAGKEVLGTRAQDFEVFPLLIKLIDAKNNLSVQVHPDDEYALLHEGGYGKTEMWYVMECDSDAYLYYGLNKTLPKDEFKKHIENDTILDILNKVPVHKGDVFFIPAGTIHAIGAGIVICEIQQNSNTTYRVYDYNRKDKDGKPRELHIEKALDVANLVQASELLPIPQEGISLLAHCKYFTVYRLRVEHKATVKINKESFHSLIVTEGRGIIRINNTETEFNKGDSFFIPAQDGCYEMIGKCEIILSHI